MAINILGIPDAGPGYSLTGKKVMVHDQSAPLAASTVLVAATAFGSSQKQPKSFLVGTTSGAPVAGTTTWVLPAFTDSYVVLFLNGVIVDMEDLGDGSPFITKVLASDTLTIGNFIWGAGDKLSYILITP